MASIVDRPARVAVGTAFARRALILAACAAAGLGAWVLGDSAPRLQADSETAQLLRSMALIKALFLLPALALVLWRVEGDIAPGLLLGYGACVTVMTAASVAVFQLSFLGLTSLAFHACLIALLVLAWRDDGVAKGPLRRA